MANFGNTCLMALMMAAASTNVAAVDEAKAVKQLSFSIDRTKQGLDSAKYVIDLSQWPVSVTSWCEGEKLTEMPFCGGKKEDDPLARMNKVVTFIPTQLSVNKIVERQNHQPIRYHDVSYLPTGKRVKAKLKSKAANGAVLANTNVLSEFPVAMVTVESLLLSRMLPTQTLPTGELHWIEPKRSKRMKLVTQDQHTLGVNHYNPHSKVQTPMFTIQFDLLGLPLKVQAQSGNWLMVRSQ